MHKISDHDVVLEAGKSGRLAGADKHVTLVERAVGMLPGLVSAGVLVPRDLRDRQHVVS